MKKMYIQPAVEQMQLLPQSMMQAGSPAPNPDPIGVVTEPMPSGQGGD